MAFKTAHLLLASGLPIVTSLKLPSRRDALFSLIWYLEFYYGKAQARASVLQACHGNIPRPWEGPDTQRDKHQTSYITPAHVLKYMCIYIYNMRTSEFVHPVGDWVSSDLKLISVGFPVNKSFWWSDFPGSEDVDSAFSRVLQTPPGWKPENNYRHILSSCQRKTHQM